MGAFCRLMSEKDKQLPPFLVGPVNPPDFEVNDRIIVTHDSEFGQSTHLIHGGFLKDIDCSGGKVTITLTSGIPVSHQNTTITVFSAE